MMMSPMPESQTRGGSVVVGLEDKREPFVQSSPPRRDSYARYACAHVSVLATSAAVGTSTRVLCRSQPLLIRFAVSGLDGEAPRQTLPYLAAERGTLQEDTDDSCESINLVPRSAQFLSPAL